MRTLDGGYDVADSFHRVRGWRSAARKEDEKGNDGLWFITASNMTFLFLRGGGFKAINERPQNISFLSPTLIRIRRIWEETVCCNWCFAISHAKITSIYYRDQKTRCSDEDQ